MSDLAIALVSVLVGAGVSLGSSWLRGRQDGEAALDLLMTQDERATVRGVLAVLHGYSVSLWTMSPKSYGKLLDSWHDLVSDPSATVRDPELQRRVDVAGQVILMARLAPKSAYTKYAVQRAIADVQEWGRGWLKRERIPDAHLPSTSAAVAELVGRGEEGIDFAPLNNYLAEILVSPGTDSEPERQAGDGDRPIAAKSPVNVGKAPQPLT